MTPQHTRVARSGWLREPVGLFLIALALVALVSTIGAASGWRVTLPDGSERIVRPLLDAEGGWWFLAHVVENFTRFPPLGVVVVGMLGISLAEQSGLLAALLRRALRGLSGVWLGPMVLLVGINSSIAMDAGYVVVPPLAAALFQAAGRSPLAGLAAAYAGVAGGYSANFALTAVDPLLAAYTEAAAGLVAPGYRVAPTCNWWFMAASTIWLMLCGIPALAWLEAALARRPPEGLAQAPETQARQAAGAAQAPETQARQTSGAAQAPETTHARRAFGAAQAPETTQARQAFGAAQAPETTQARQASGAAQAPETTQARQASGAAQAPETTQAGQASGMVRTPETQAWQASGAARGPVAAASAPHVSPDAATQRDGAHGGESGPSSTPLTAEDEDRALRPAVCLLVVLLSLIAWSVMSTDGLLAGQGERHARVIEASVPLLALCFGLPALVHGHLSGRLRGLPAVTRALERGLAALAPYLVVTFFAAQFLAAFQYTGLGEALAVRAGDWLADQALPVLALLLLTMFLVMGLDLLIASASAKYALLAPVLVPTLMGAGLSPELVQAAYRVGDSVTNVISPLNPYLVIMLGFLRHHAPAGDFALLLRLMLPFVLCFALAWPALLLGWVWLEIPLGPAGPLSFSPAAAGHPAPG